MKKRLTAFITVFALLCLIPYSGETVRAEGEDFANNQDYYDSVCRQYNKDSETTAMCSRYRKWLSNESKKLSNEVADINSSIEKLKSDIVALQLEINKNQASIDKLDAQIAKNEAAIEQIQGVIENLLVEIKKTEIDIELRDHQIKDRMVSEQASIGTNVYVEFIMGAKDLVDMVRIVDGIARITENDQDEIKALEADKAKLDQQKVEQERLKSDQETAKKENEKNRAVVVRAKEVNEILINEYRKNEADLNEKMRSAVESRKILDLSLANLDYQQSNGWLKPVRNAYISAGTWNYPNGGGYHAGQDFAADIGTPIYAPIGGVIVYARNPIPTYNGFLGNWVGYPAGGGNTVHMIGIVNGTTYAVSFFHMAQENFLVSGGMAISQGQQIGAVGNTGNSTGAHCHVEVINLGNLPIEDAVAQFANGADFSWGCGWNTTSTSCDIKGTTPCRERPEKFFG